MLAATQLAILEAEVWIRDRSAYTLVSAVRVTGVPDWLLLADAVDTTLTRHDVFSWRLSLDSAYQVVASSHGTAFTTEQVDLRAISTEEAEHTVETRLACERRRVINLLDASGEPYTRVIMFRMPGGKPDHGEAAVCALVTHHIFLDEHATELVWNEVFQRAAGRDFPDHYDRRYAHWSAASMCAAGTSAARQAAQEVVKQLRSTPLGWIPRRSSHLQGETPQPPLRFTLPSGLRAAVSEQAAALAVPVTAVYAAALVGVLSARASGQNLAIHVPMTCRKTSADLDVVGCYVSAIPVLARNVGADPASEKTVLRWHRSLAFASEHAHADITAIRAAIGSAPQVSLAFESRSGFRTARPISWQPMPPPDSIPKYGLAVFLSPGSRSHAGDGRLIWQPDVLDAEAARALVDEFLSHVWLLATLSRRT